MRSPRLAAWLAAGICVAVALLAWSGLRTSREFQRSSRLLVERRADEAARLLVTALNRDMRGVQASVLSSSTWDDFGPDSSHEVTALVASAFARYPYPEAFVTWDAGQPAGQLLFYTRTDRPAIWALEPPGPKRYPVRVLLQPIVAEQIIRTVRVDAASGRAFSASELSLAGSRYQAVVLFRYSDRLRQHLRSVRGFMVNLGWVRAHYFGDLTRQVAQIGGDDAGLALAILDERGAVVVGTPNLGSGSFVSRRTFPMAFYDPIILAGNWPVRVQPPTWTVLVRAAGDRVFGLGLYGSDLTLGIAAVAAFVLAISVGVTARAMRRATELAQMRADFMSSVTHELKTPIANIQAMASTLTGRRVRDPQAQREYAAAVMQEARRLARLVDNLLAHSRVTDVADVYTFEPVEVEELVVTALADFEQQLKQDHFAVHVDIPADIPLIMADRMAMHLLLCNLIDNAIRHAGPTKEIRFAVKATIGRVLVTLSDRGRGIRPEDLSRVTQKFVRGGNAGTGGSGLGLSIVARIVSDHDGTFTIESSVGQGTRVTIVLPAAADERIYAMRR